MQCGPMAHTCVARRLCGFAALARRCSAAATAPPSAARAAACGPLRARALTWHAASCAGPPRAARPAATAGAQLRSRHVAAAADGEPSEALVADCCPGCGVHLQATDPDAPGFYQVPKRITEPKEEPSETGTELPFTLSAEEEAAQAAAAGAGGEVAELETLDALFEEERAPKRAVAPTPARFAERKVVCARCYALEHYGRVKSVTAEALLPAFDFEAIVGGKLRRAAARTRPVVLLVVDVADFDGSFPAVAARMLSSIGDSLHVVLAATKADLLPKNASPARLENWVRRRAKAGGLTVLDSVRFVGAPARFGISALAAQLEALSRQRSGAEVWVVGAQNAGKSSLINALSAHYYGDAFRAGPVASHVPGTTLGLVRLEALLPGGRSVVDTPGLLHAHALSARLLPDEARLVLPRRPLRPRTFRVAPGAAVTVGALFRIEVLESPGATLYLTVWASADVSTHFGKADNADELLQRHGGGALKPPLSAERVAELGAWASRTVTVTGESWTASTVDVAVAGAGWVGVGVAGEAKLRVWTYPGVAVTARPALLPDYAREMETPGFDYENAGKTRGGRDTKTKPKQRRH